MNRTYGSGVGLWKFIFLRMSRSWKRRGKKVGWSGRNGVGKFADQLVGTAVLKAEYGRSGYIPASSWKRGIGYSTRKVGSFTLKYWLRLHAITFYQLGEESRAGTT